jgi:hypothetical protein
VVLWRTAPRRNVAEKTQGICLVAPFLARTGMPQRLLDEGIEQGLGLRINPVEMLEDQQERLLLAFAQ